MLKPEPLSSRRYSGKFMVRVPPEVHQRLALEAAKEDISLNRLVSCPRESNRRVDPTRRSNRVDTVHPVQPSS